MILFRYKKSTSTVDLKGQNVLISIYIFLIDNKRKGEEQTENPSAKTKKVEKKCSDLIVLGLPYKSSEDDLREYFSKFGELVLAQVCQKYLSPFGDSTINFCKVIRTVLTLVHVHVHRLVFFFSCWQRETFEI